MRLSSLLTTAAAAACGLFVASPAGAWTIDQPGLYTLGGDLFNEEIVIASSDVELDCEGHKVWRAETVDAPIEACTGGRHGISINGNGWWLYNVTVKNCNVAGWDSGIRAGYVENLTVQSNSAHHNWDGFDLNHVNNLWAPYNTASTNGGTCEGKLNGDGYDLDMVQGGTLLFSSAYDNFDHGYSVNNFKQECHAEWFNTNITIENATIIGNKGRGVNFKETHGGKLRNNYFENNGEGAYGLKCSQSIVVCGNACGNATCGNESACE